jgi:hypothetical protein
MQAANIGNQLKNIRSRIDSLSADLSSKIDYLRNDIDTMQGTLIEKFDNIGKTLGDKIKSTLMTIIVTFFATIINIALALLIIRKKI